MSGRGFWTAAAGAVLAGVLAAMLRVPDPVSAPAMMTAREASVPEAARDMPNTKEGEDAIASMPAPEPGEGWEPAPCAGCLDERAAMDVAETLYSHHGERALGVRTELYADIPWLTREVRRMPWPEGLEGAPTVGRVSPELPYLKGTRSDETWVVWFHHSWLSHAKLEEWIRSGDLPPVARAWPPVKRVMFILVDARTGAIVGPTSYHTSVGPREKSALDAAAERARHWLAQTGDRAAGVRPLPAR